MSRNPNIVVIEELTLFPFFRCHLQDTEEGGRNRKLYCSSLVWTTAENHKEEKETWFVVLNKVTLREHMLPCHVLLERFCNVSKATPSSRGKKENHSKSDSLLMCSISCGFLQGFLKHKINYYKWQWPYSRCHKQGNRSMSKWHSLCWNLTILQQLKGLKITLFIRGILERVSNSGSSIWPMVFRAVWKSIFTQYMPTFF